MTSGTPGLIPDPFGGKDLTAEGFDPVFILVNALLKVNFVVLGAEVLLQFDVNIPDLLLRQPGVIQPILMPLFRPSDPGCLSVSPRFP